MTCSNICERCESYSVILYGISIVMLKYWFPHYRSIASIVMLKYWFPHYRSIASIVMLKYWFHHYRSVAIVGLVCVCINSFNFPFVAFVGNCRHNIILLGLILNMHTISACILCHNDKTIWWTYITQPIRLSSMHNM